MLADAEQRQRYDRFGHAGVSRAPDKPGERRALAVSKISLATFLDSVMCLEAVAAARVARQRNAAPILRYDLEITLEDAYNGMTAQLRIPRLEYLRNV